MGALKERGIVRTKNIVGDLGERYAELEYCSNPNLPNIRLAKTNSADVDAVAADGAEKRFSIKAASLGSTRTSAFHLPYDHSESAATFDVLIVVRLDELLRPRGIFQYTWAQFWQLKQWNSRQLAWFLPLTKQVLAMGIRVDVETNSAN